MSSVKHAVISLQVVHYKMSNLYHNSDQNHGVAWDLETHVFNKRLHCNWRI